MTHQAVRGYKNWRCFPTMLSAPFATVIYIDSVYAGVHIFLSPFERNLLAKVLPHQEIYIIATMLIIGGLLSFIGVLFDNPRIERSGLAPFATSIGLTGISILYTVGLRFGDAWLDILLALAALIRFYRLGIGAQLRVEAFKQHEQHE